MKTVNIEVLHEDVYSDGSGISGTYKVYGQTFSGIHNSERVTVTPLHVRAGYRSPKEKGSVSTATLAIKQHLEEKYARLFPGGYRENPRYSRAELARGIEHELEHTDDRRVAKQIALDHLRAHPDYYTKLEACEKTMRKNGGGRLMQALLDSADKHGGLASVPEAVKASGLSPETAKRQLLAAYAADWIELRPEGGMGRLSKADAALCPVGAGGLPLSWVRFREDYLAPNGLQQAAGAGGGSVEEMAIQWAGRFITDAGEPWSGSTKSTVTKRIRALVELLEMFQIDEEDVDFQELAYDVALMVLSVRREAQKIVWYYFTAQEENTPRRLQKEMEDLYRGKAMKLNLDWLQVRK